MGLLALLLAGLVGWMLWKDKDKTRRRSWFAVLLLVGAVLLLVKGAWFPAGLLAAGAAWVHSLGRIRKPTALNDLSSQLAEARALLGVGPDADVDAINAAHRRLIASAHPDAGGTPERAGAINAARDLLLRNLVGRTPDRQ